MLSHDVLLDFLCPLEEGQMSSDGRGLKASSPPGAATAWEAPERCAVTC